jgi:hypothetical protein
MINLGCCIDGWPAWVGMSRTGTGCFKLQAPVEMLIRVFEVEVCDATAADRVIEADDQKKKP